ncbi:MAG: GntR family transcriptional regulator, partial [Oscillospiraceae bacterium]
DMLPSENELAQQYETSRVTVRKSLQNLESEGLIYACQGKGYFIAQPLHNDFCFHFSEEERGFEVSYRKVDACFPSDRVREALEIGSTQMVIEIRRIIKKRGHPVALDIKYIPYDKGEPTLETELHYAVFPDIAAAKTAPFAFHTRMEIGAELPTDEVAAQLQCSMSSPLLVVYRYLIDQSGRGVGYGIKYMLSEYGRLDAKSGYEL